MFMKCVGLILHGSNEYFSFPQCKYPRLLCILKKSTGRAVPTEKIRRFQLFTQFTVRFLFQMSAGSQIQMAPQSAISTTQPVHNQDSNMSTGIKNLTDSLVFFYVFPAEFSQTGSKKTASFPRNSNAM